MNTEDKEKEPFFGIEFSPLGEPQIVLRFPEKGDEPRYEFRQDFHTAFVAAIRKTFDAMEKLEPEAARDYYERIASSIMLGAIEASRMAALLGQLDADDQEMLAFTEKVFRSVYTNVIQHRTVAAHPTREGGDA